MPMGTLIKKIQRHEYESVIQPPKRRPDGRRHHDGHRVQSKRRRALGGWKGIHQDGLLARSQPAARDALQHSEEDQPTQGLVQCRTGMKPP